MNNGRKLLIAVAAGAVAGFVAGLLLAPKKGTETRKDIKDGFAGAEKSIKDNLEAVKQKFSNVKDAITG